MQQRGVLWNELEASGRGLLGTPMSQLMEVWGSNLRHISVLSFFRSGEHERVSEQNPMKVGELKEC